jgi:hypothetical protein
VEQQSKVSGTRTVIGEIEALLDQVAIERLSGSVSEIC